MPVDNVFNNEKTNPFIGFLIVVVGIVLGLALGWYFFKPESEVKTPDQRLAEKVSADNKRNNEARAVQRAAKASVVASADKPSQAEGVDVKAGEQLFPPSSNQTQVGVAQSVIPNMCLTKEAMKEMIAESCQKKEAPRVASAKPKAKVYAHKPKLQATPPQQRFAIAPAPVAPLPMQVSAKLKPGGCIYESDGTAVLKGTTTKQPAGTRLAIASDAELENSRDPQIVKMLSQHPEAFIKTAGHRAMCAAWSNLVAARIQQPDGLKVNDDTHRVSSN